MTLYWQALGDLAQDYSVFVHIYEPAGTGIVSQHDGWPSGGTAPTSTWLEGEVVADEHTVVIGADVSSGSAPIGVGMYVLDTGDRLPVLLGGELQPDGRLIIGEVALE